jgi:hypothetical protein
MEIFFTVISGVLIFILGQIFLKFFIEPYYLCREVVGMIVSNLIFYSRLYCNYFNVTSIDDKRERQIASDKLRDLSTELIVKVSAVPFYDKLFDLKDIKEAARDLILISNRMFITAKDSTESGLNLLIENQKEEEKIFKLLGVRFKLD